MRELEKMRVFSYPIEKLKIVEHTLTLGSGDMRSRMLTAFSALAVLKSDDCPKELCKDFEWVMKKFHLKEPYRYPDGKVMLGGGGAAVSMRSIKNKTAVEMARKLIKIKERLEELEN